MTSRSLVVSVISTLYPITARVNRRDASLDEEEGQPQDAIDGQELHAFVPGGLSALGDLVSDQDGEEDGGRRLSPVSVLDMLRCSDNEEWQSSPTLSDCKHHSSTSDIMVPRRILLCQHSHAHK